MLWVDGGAIYALVDADVKEFAPSVDNALNITVAGGKVYWTEMTGESGGTINSANLDGTGATTLASILSVPMGIAVDATGNNLYWTNARGRIQRANLDGSGIQNVLQELSGPTDIVVSNGFIYWTEGGNSIRRVNVSGQKIVGDVAANLGTVGGLAVGGGKVYWTETDGCIGR
jgi:DNA-binding beta-propeller fold protein YncE